MKKTKTKSFNPLTSAILIGLFGLTTVVTGVAVWHAHNYEKTLEYKYPDSNYGSFLAQQHAIYVNDFDTAADFATTLHDVDVPLVKSTNALVSFLTGSMPATLDGYKGDDSLAGRLVYSAYLISEDDWKSVYEKFKTNNSAFLAPIRIWSGIATNHITATLKFVDSLPANDSWKSFIRGQIYVETGKSDKAVKEFEKVSPDFLNINDYMYLMSFYESRGMLEHADRLYGDFTSRPGGLFMINFPIQYDFAAFSGIKNALSFGLIQTVSHSQAFGATDLSLVMLRMAEFTSGTNSDALNYYLGLYFYNTGGDFNKYFARIPEYSVFFPFVLMKDAEFTPSYKKSVRMLERLVDNNPLFLPAINNLVAKKLQKGDQRDAIKIINRTLGYDDLPPVGRAFLLKSRALAYMQMGKLDLAQSDIWSASDILPADSGIIMSQAQIWALGGRELDTAYTYAIALVKRFPADIQSWDTLGLVVWKKEGPAAALEIMERVGRVAANCSSLFEHLGDIYVELGKKFNASEAYQKAINLSDDGLVSEPALRKKLRKVR